MFVLSQHVVQTTCKQQSICDCRSFCVDCAVALLETQQQTMTLMTRAAKSVVCQHPNNMPTTSRVVRHLRQDNNQPRGRFFPWFLASNLTTKYFCVTFLLSGGLKSIVSIIPAACSCFPPFASPLTHVLECHLCFDSSLVACCSLSATLDPKICCCCDEACPYVTATQQTWLIAGIVKILLHQIFCTNA
jgi:hypothetical protein